jgi:hypothetical protein
MTFDEEPAPGFGRALPAPMPVEDLRKLLRYNAETGGMTWLVERGCNAHRMRPGSIAGTISSNGYLVIKINGRFYKGHRLAWYLASGEWPDRTLEIDHINEVKGDNRLCNLRLVTRSENQKNIASKRTWRPTVRPEGPRRAGRGFWRPAPMAVDEMLAILTYDRVTGILAWARDCGGKDNKRIKAGTPAGGYSPQGYIVIRMNKVLYPAHRLAWFIETGDWPDLEVDHVNGVRDDNRWENLRLATSSQNNMNRQASRPNTTGFRGVIYWRGKWRAQIKIDGRQTGLGTFDTPEAAHDAYRAAVLSHHGEFGRVT